MFGIIYSMLDHAWNTLSNVKINKDNFPNCNFGNPNRYRISTLNRIFSTYFETSLKYYKIHGQITIMYY